MRETECADRATLVDQIERSSPLEHRPLYATVVSPFDLGKLHHYARASGYRLAVLHAVPLAETLYQSIGFSTIAGFRRFSSQDVQV